MKSIPFEISDEHLQQIVLQLRYGCQHNDATYIYKSIYFISRVTGLSENKIKIMLADREPDHPMEPLATKFTKKRLTDEHIDFVCNWETLRR